MKTVYLLFNRLRTSFIKNKFIFILFVIGGIINAAFLSYLFGNAVSFVANRNSDEIYYREYYLYANDDTYELDYVKRVFSEPSENELFESVSVGSRFCKEQDVAYLCTTITEKLSLVRQKGTFEFTSENQVIIPSDDLTNIGDKIEFFGTQFEVIGQHTLPLFEYYIPVEAYLKLDIPSNFMYALASKRQPLSEDKAFEALSEAFPSSHIKKPLMALNDVKSSGEQLIVIACCYAVSALSYFFLLIYLIDSLMDETIISMIVGASKSDISVIVFWEAFLLTLISNAGGIFAHLVLYKPFFSKINVSPAITYKVSDYLFICLIIVTVTTVITIPFVRKYMKLSPAKARREHG